MTNLLEALREASAKATDTNRLTRIFHDAGGSDELTDLLNDLGLESSRELAREIIAALEERERLRADAARYRWLRDHSCPPHNFYISVPDEFHGVRYTTSEVDAYIDEARAALTGSSET